MTSWQFIVTLNVLVHVLRARDRSKKPDLRRLKTEVVSFSGDSLEHGRVWIWVTATFGHNGWGHLLNNTVHLIATAPTLEQSIGSWFFLVCYIVTGAMGWLFTFIYNRYFAGGVDIAAMGMTVDDAWNTFTRYNDSIGSSPATYGLGIMCASVVPMQKIGTFLRLGGWHYITLIVIINLVSSRKYGLQLVEWSQAGEKKEDNAVEQGPHLNWKGGLVVICLLITSVLFDEILPAPTGWSFFCMYLTKTCCFTLYSHWKDGKNVPPDNACHLGGALLGYALSYWSLLGQDAQQCCHELNLFAPGLLHHLCLARLSNWCCLAYLTFRLLKPW